MAFHIRNRETEALARRLAAAEGTGLTEAVHRALEHELERVRGAPDLVEETIALVRELRARGNPAEARPADKAFIDSLYDDE